MINHLSLYETDKLTDRFGLVDGVPKGVKSRYNIVPATIASVIVAGDNGPRLTGMRWGLVSQGAKDFNAIFRYKTFNVMSEKVFSKPTWDVAVHTQRCIIPVNGFYLLRNDDSDDAYYFSMADGSLMALAGIYTSGSDIADEAQRTCTLLTIESNDAMPLPFGRMPLILTKTNELSWLDTSVTDMSSIVQGMRPFNQGVLSYRRVSSTVASLKIDEPSLITAIKT